MSACGDADVVMREENVFLEPKEYEDINERVEERFIDNKEEQRVLEEEFSLIEGQEKIVSLNNTDLAITLLGTTNRSAGFLIDDQRISIGMGSPLRRDEYELTLIETTMETVPVPRKSWMDISVNKGSSVSQRLLVYVGETYNLVFDDENVSVSLEFIGRSDEEEKGRLKIGTHIIYAGEKEEEYWNDGLFLYVHGVFFNDANEFDLADGATIRFVER
ncbi:hypothetical protein GOV10_05090 [Candidatus Woesearchaeota archaeon]|nr:hypothetical protein [Candidatus Woesearchaeota archaeon]